MLSSLGYGNAGGSNGGVKMPKSSLHGRAATDGDARSPSARSANSANASFSALMASEREAALATPRPPDNSATPRPGAVQAAEAAEAAVKAQAEAAANGRWFGWARRAGRNQEGSQATLGGHQRNGTVLSDVEDVYEEPEKYTAANGYAKDSIGRSSLASTGTSASYTGNNADFGYGSEARRDQAKREKRRKKYAPPEILILVRPPPSKQSNPLNLQIQLVTPLNQQGSGSRVSGELSRDDSVRSGVGSNGQPSTPGSAHMVRRSNSMSSQRSGRSEASSGGLSTTSSAGASRRVTPLYNLSFHSLLPTTVSDAGNDQKIAKFGRKGVEIDGFGQLEPRELIPGINEMRRSSGPLSTLGSDVSPPQGSGSDVGILVTDEEPPTSFESMTPEAQAPPETAGGRLLNKFKRFSLQGGRPGSSAGSTGNVPTSAGPFGRFSLALNSGGASATSIRPRGSMDTGAPSLIDSSLAGSTTSANGSDVPQMVPASGLSTDGRRKTVGYYWSIRKLNRGVPGEVINAPPRVDAEGQNPVLASVWKRFNLINRQAGEVQVLHPPIDQIPIRFEWTKDPHARRASRSSRRSSRVLGHGRAATDAVSPAPRPIAARRGSFDIETAVSGSSDRAAGAQALSEKLATPNGVVAPLAGNLRPPSNAGSRPGSVHSARRSMESSALDDTTSSHGDAEEDDGYGSDPEDSETAWSCHLVLGPETRIPIGSLAPAPHHPKIVGQLAIPFPLPDLSASGLGADGAGLSREELKDIVCTTCFFLTIREGWGGIGTRKRKGESGLRMAAAQHMRPL